MNWKKLGAAAALVRRVGVPATIPLLLIGADAALAEKVRQAATTALGPVEFFTGSLPQEQPGAALLVVAESSDAPQMGERLVETVRVQAESSPEQLVEALRAARERLELRHSNAVLRGSLQTIARRFSHDLRTPLGSVLTLGQLLQELTPAGNVEEQKLLGSVVRSAERLRELIDKMSLFARTAVTPLELGPVAMGEVVSLVRGRVEMQVRARQAQVEQSATWPTVRGNAAALETVWRQLLNNALTHAGEAPQITLGWREETPGTYCFFVRDRGPGIPPERRDALFVPFELLHESLAAHGLGLSLVRHIVTQHGGTCAGTPLPEGGWEASFTLPAAR